MYISRASGEQSQLVLLLEDSHTERNRKSDRKNGVAIQIKRQRLAFARLTLTQMPDVHSFSRRFVVLSFDSSKSLLFVCFGGLFFIISAPRRTLSQCLRHPSAYDKIMIMRNSDFHILRAIRLKFAIDASF